MERLCSGDAVLMVWRDAETASLERLAGEVRARTGRGPQLEHAERLLAAALAAASWDATVVEDTDPTDELLAEVLRVLKPRGVLVLPPPPTSRGATHTDLALRLKLNGFVEVARVKDYLVAEKPNFEVGSRSALRGAVWRLEPEDEVEAAWGAAAPPDAPLLDAQQLLDADDIKKPDAAALRVCASTGARKACADCSCGLAEELRGAESAGPAPTSSCGSCYLGDAFRCSTCPYLGTPAFQPGERVLIADLRSDI